MIEKPLISPLVLDQSVEADVKKLLIDHFSPSYEDRVDDYIENILQTKHYGGRFEFLRSVIGSGQNQPHSNILISGFSAGSEMLVARQYGFGKVYGVEVDKFLVSITQKRLSYFPEMFPIYYDGEILPYPENFFDTLASGHIIEHTASPKKYLRECNRVLKKGGYLFLEFPHRYHKIELHTQLRSFEWMPRFLRNIVILLLSSQISPIPKENKSRYRSIYDTNLQQISLKGVEKILNRLDPPAVVIQSIEESPGIIRCVVQKE